ncbi:MAG TPA: glycosyl hydrolase family 18 protein [Anaerolineae bacterium]|nr:glycosyl hydrolase family 18 protein [Anaerolineae bacterium]
MTLSRLAVMGGFLIFLLAACTTTLVPTATSIPTPAATPIVIPTTTPMPTITVTPTVQPIPSPTRTPMPEKVFRIIGYAASWEGPINPAQLPYLTHVNYAFLLPNADGSVQDVANPSILEDLVAQAHVQNVKVLISIGGWETDKEFKQLAASPESRRRFVTAVIDFVRQYHLDGADVDWEYPEASSPSADHFTLLMRELRAQLPPDKLLTAAVAVGENADGVQADAFALADFLNVMAYDGPGQNHSSYEFAEEALNYWQQRGLPPNKMVLGVPFYSRPGEARYRQLVASDPAAAQVDAITYNGATTYYNGLPTMQKKTALAKRLGSGIMIWTIASDTVDETSLLKTIDRAAR